MTQAATNDYLLQHRIDGPRENGWYVEKDPEHGDVHIAQDLADAIGHTLGFCGCGCPEEALRYYRDVLRSVKLAHEPGPWEEKRERIKTDRKALFISTGAEYAMWYVLHDKGLTDHGGSVPGWLSEKGESLLALLETIDFDADDETPVD